MAIIKNRIKSSKKNIILIYNLILLFLKSFNFLVFIIVGLLFLYIVKPVKLSNFILECVGNTVSIGNKVYLPIVSLVDYILDNIKTINDLKIENTLLNQRLVFLEHQLEDKEIIISENKSLKQLLSVVDVTGHSYITAKLLTVSNNLFGKIAIIQAGSNDGIKQGQVVTDGRYLIGRILELSDNYSSISLIENTETRVPVITSQSLERGILTWNNNALDIAYLDDNTKLISDEIILTSGDGMMYPPNIPIAQVIFNNDKIYFKLLSNLAKTNFVTVILKD